MSEKKYTFLQVRAVHHYIIEGEHSEEYLKRIAEEWFMEHSLTMHHAGRDSSEIGGAAFALDVKEISSEELKKTMDKNEDSVNSLKYDDLPDYYYPKEDTWELEEHWDLLETENIK